MMAISSAASATEKSITPMSPSNKKAPGANKAAQRAAMKLRRIKAHKARIK